jgi:hypothetical protein
MGTSTAWESVVGVQAGFSQLLLLLLLLLLMIIIIMIMIIRSAYHVSLDSSAKAGPTFGNVL